MKHVVKETGIKPDTLRAWERRYGMPNPQRTEGRHRLYSQHEIDSLKWLLARQEEGMSISHAIELWQQIETQNENPLVTLPISKKDIVPDPVLSGDSLDNFRNNWLDACMAFDGPRAQVYLAQAFAIYPVETVCFELLQKGLQEVGQGWYEGRVTVQQEHFTSSQASRQLAVLMAVAPASSRPERILVACPPQEHHTFATFLITFLLRRRGWDIVYLGANVPLDRFAAAVESIKPHLVIVSAQTLRTAATTREMAELMLAEGVALAFGGGIFNRTTGIRRLVPGHFLGETLAEIPRAVQTYFETVPPPFPVIERRPEVQLALIRFRRERAAIEADLHLMPELAHMAAELKRMINKQLGDQITAALTLGEMDLMDDSIDWVVGLLSHHTNETDALLRRYLALYEHLVEKHLGEDGGPLLDWLRSQTT